MLDKKLLLKLAIPKLPKNRSDAIYRADNISYLVKSKRHLNKKMLVIAFYERAAASSGYSLPTAVLYITKKEYITRIYSVGKQEWKKSRIRYLIPMKDRKHRCLCMTERDEIRIRSFLSIKQEYKDIDAHIQRYQESILENRIKQKKKLFAEKTDRAMKVIPSLPKAFDKWIDREPLLHSRYIYYRRTTKKKASCYCTYCGSNMIFDQIIPVHNQDGICLSCGSKIIFKAIGKSTKVSDNAYACILQRLKNGGYLLRYFMIERSFYKHYSDPKTNYDERARLFLSADGKITGQYKNGWSAQTGRYGWYPTQDVITGSNAKITWEIKLGMYARAMNVWFWESHLYPCNLRYMLKNLNLSYDIIGNLKGRAIDVTTYFMRSFTYPFAPSLWRIGLGKMGSDLLEEYCEPNVYQSVGSLHTRFGISKEFLQLMREKDLGMKAVNLRSMMKKEPNEDEFIWALENKVDGNHLDFLLRYTTFHKIKTYTEQQIKTKILRCGNWVYEYTTNKIIGFWKDYLSMCEKLGYDLSKKSVLFPRIIKDEHDKVAQLIRIQHDPVIDEKIKAIYAELNSKYYYDDEDYLIRPPMDFNEFIKEGTTLLHCVCVNDYYVRHVEGSRFIFFIRKRKNPDAPFYTMEYDPVKQRIVQCYGYRHLLSTPKIKEFTGEWLNRYVVIKNKVAA